MNTLRIGLISVSDRAANGIYQDQGIPALESWLGSAISSPANSHPFKEQTHGR